MTYLLDTNTCIALLNNRPDEVANRLATHQPDEIFLCQIVKAELYYGAYRSERVAENLALLAQFCQQFASLPFTDQAVDIYGQIRADLARQGNLIGPNDFIIAATALAHNVILVTHNLGEFSRVANLKLEDWVAVS